ncbi:MAG: redoxin domain-containing protein [Desulfuromonas sp.]|nr:redoxin domain-containing protein [Desulfuromonas sp.]
MAQLRRHAQEFSALKVRVVIVGPEKTAAFAAYWNKAGLDDVALNFVGIPDPEHQILNLYAQPNRLLRLGRMPMQVLIDQTGVLRWKHIGSSMADIPALEIVLGECRKVA